MYSHHLAFAIMSYCLYIVDYKCVSSDLKNVTAKNKSTFISDEV